MKRIMDILGIIFCTLSICFIIIFSIMVIQLYRYNKCRNSEYTYDYCEKYRDFWKEKTEMKNLINYMYIYIYILRKRGGTTLIVPSQNRKEVEVI